MTYDEARSQFPVLERFAYLNAGSLGPLIEKPFTVQGILQKVRDVLSAEGSNA